MARIQRITIQKALNDPNNHDGVITHLEPDTLEWEVKWALGSITTKKASGDDGILAELFQILKRWCCENATLSMKANLENTAVPTGLEKVSIHSNPKERQCQRMFKLLHNCTHLSSFQSLSHVPLFMTPWTATCKASLFFINSQS